MPTVWLSLKKSLHCKSEPSEVHDPKSKKNLGAILTRKTGGGGRSGCSRSIANLKDVINGGSRRHLDKPPSCSPRSIGSSEFLNPITHEVILSNSKCELKITGFHGGFPQDLPPADTHGGASTFVGTLTPGTPGPGGHPSMHYFNPSLRSSSKKFTFREGFGSSNKSGGGAGGGARGSGVHLSNRISLETENSRNGCSSAVTCHKCGEQFNKWDAAEAHHLSKHAVTELVEGDSSRKIVEIICRTSWLKSENQSGRIERVLKVHNMQRTLARFEEYRETVKIKASKLPKKHPRCLADGNELLRFYGTTVACLLGLNGSSSLCISEKCCVCRIIRNGFSAKTEMEEGIGVFTTSTSARAFSSIKGSGGDEGMTRKAMIVCRVIAGRVHRPLENIQEMAGQTGFDSLAGKVGLHSNIEELYLLNPRALLPCFVVICKP
ncbi:hypothetical protein IC582_014411 [Cucumis melo]|uniref:Uncharacterized protein LOC103493380 n=2 Tax=Cucumis melo TaxID=3656 RepID=A0A1S3BUD2_CUCME|nr:uncharacterized protein LOC103493380 [Cucumis melo]TYK03237.1 Transcription factor [Cucumis melo var. makuwa]